MCRSWWWCRDGDRRKLTQALEMGVNDYLTRPGGQE